MRVEFQDSEVPEPLGVGFPYIPGLPTELYQCELLDFVEITPETLCQEPIDQIAGSITLIPKQLETALSTCGRLPIVVHGVELSIGSAHSWNDSYLNMLDEFQRFCPFLWHSEHIGFQTILGNDGT